MHPLTRYESESVDCRDLWRLNMAEVKKNILTEDGFLAENIFFGIN